MFQSISYWKLLWKFAAYTGYKIDETVSIHLLLEIALEGQIAAIRSTSEMMFQSISYWKLLWKAKSPQ